MKTLFIYLSLWLLASCAPKAQQGPFNPRALSRQWMLTKMEGFTKEELAKAGAFIDLTDLKKQMGKQAVTASGLALRRRLTVIFNFPAYYLPACIAHRL